MKFLIDNQLPPALAAFLRSCGHDCYHVFERQQDSARDHDLWAQCAAEQRIVVSKDEDFLYFANRPGDSGRFIWVRVGNCSKAALLKVFESTLDAIISALENGQRVIEIR